MQNVESNAAQSTQPAKAADAARAKRKLVVDPPDVVLGGPTYRSLFGKSTRVAALVAVGLSLVLPNGGNLGISLCWFKRWTNLPCPGCGLTRSFVCLGHGHLHDAFHMHPFGPFLFLVAIASVVGFALGEKRRMSIAAWFSRYPRFTRYTYWCVVISFLVFGFVRLAAVKYFPGTFDNV